MNGRLATKTMWGVVGVLLLALPLSACGDDDDGGGTSDNTTPQTSLTVEAKDYSFSPANWKVPAGQEISIEFTNNGSIEHEWAVINLGMALTSGDDFTEDHVLWEIEKQPAGTTVTETFTWDTPGTYQIVCALDGHVNAGMAAILTVS
jgi:plastocyanin